ncbi:MAG: hypothetical protein HZB38_02180 [Planctomycetes bacterium]|nr:hypothetical protein [Planctomycetota bacterium]
MPASVPAVVDDWTLYTNDFIRRYELDSEQEQKAREILRARQIERDRYLQRKNADIERITLLAQNAANDEERAAAEHDADRLQAPIDRMFQQLKDKLNTLPTRAQRARAEPASRPAREATSTPATSSPANAG